MSGYVSMGLKFFTLMLRSRVPTRGLVMPPSPSNGKREPFMVSMLHQLRCIDVVRDQLTKPRAQRDEQPARHCMNYIRQMILCAADLTLEPVDIGHEASGVGVTHTCRDWRTVYDTVDRNYAEWTEYFERFEEQHAHVD